MNTLERLLRAVETCAPMREELRLLTGIPEISVLADELDAVVRHGVDIFERHGGHKL